MNGILTRMTGLTKTYNFYDVVKVPFPFIDIEVFKIRPALILSCPNQFNGKIGSCIMTMVTSIKPSQDLWPADIEITNIQSAGLTAPSIIRFKIFTLD